MDQDSPLLEFDPDPRGVLEPSERFQGGVLPERLVLCFFPKALQALLERSETRVACPIKTFGVIDRQVHVVRRGDAEVALFQSGIGAPLAAGFLEELIALGVRKALACGGAGVLDRGIFQGQLIVPTSAIRDEGLSHHYLAAGREAEPGDQALEALRRALEARQVPFLTGKTWTTDGLYRETRGKVARRRAEGALCVEMEAAAFFAVARFRGIQLAQLLYGGDDVSGRSWDERGWHSNWSVQEKMLELCLEAVTSF